MTMTNQEKMTARDMKDVLDIMEQNKSRQRVTVDTPARTIVAIDLTGQTDCIERFPASYLGYFVYMGLLTNCPGRCLIIDREGVANWPTPIEQLFIVDDYEIPFDDLDEDE